jgi:hypothetical protein
MIFLAQIPAVSLALNRRLIAGNPYRGNIIERGFVGLLASRRDA